MFKIRYFYAALILVLVSACGGGGGGGESAASERPAIVQPEAPKALAELKQEESVRYLFAAQHLSEIVLLLSGDLHSPGRFSLLDYFFPTHQDINCVSGVSNVSGNLESARSMTLELTNCSTGFLVGNGVVRYQITAGTFPTSYTAVVNLDDLRLRTAGIEMRYSGSFKIEKANARSFSDVSEGFLTLDVVSSTDSYNIEELEISNGRIVGQVFSSLRDGRIDFSYVENERLLTLDGINGSQLTARIQASTTSTNVFDYQIRFDSVSGDTSSSLVPVINLIDVPLTSPQPPIAVVSNERNVDRLGDLLLSATASTDQNHDPLKYSLVLASEAENCNEEVVQIALGEFTFRSECQGTNSLRLSVSDGVDIVPLDFDVTVVPLPAEFSNIEPITLNEGEPIDLALSVINLAEDGPFEFGLKRTPNGLGINGEGRITGVPKTFTNNPQSTINLTATAENGRTSDIDVQITVNTGGLDRKILSQADPCFPRDTSWLNINNDEHLEMVCQHLDAFRIVQFDEVSLTYRHLYTHPSMVEEGSTIFSVNLQDIDGDGVAEVIVGAKRNIYVLNGNSFEVMVTTPLPWETVHPGYRILSIPGGRNEILVASGITDSFHLLSLDGVSREYDGSFNIILDEFDVVNLDADAEPEIVKVGNFSEIFDLGNASRETPERVDYTADVDGDGIDELLRINGARDGDNDYFSETTFVLDWFAAADFSLLGSTSFSLPVIPLNGRGVQRIFLKNLDTDSKKELLFHSGFPRELFVYDIELNGITLLASQALADGTGFLPTFHQAGSLVLMHSDEIGNDLYLVDIQRSNILREMVAITPSGLQGFIDRSISKPYVLSEGAARFYSIKGFSSVTETIVNDNSEVLQHREILGVSPPLLASGFEEIRNGSQLLVDTPPSQGLETNHRVYDRQTGALISETTFIANQDSRYNFQSAGIDIDGDSKEDTIGLANAYLSWFDVEADQEIFSAGGTDDIRGVNVVLPIDYDNDAKTDLVLIDVRSGDLFVEVWGLVESAMVLKDSQLLRESSGSNVQAGLQDVNDDGDVEIIISVDGGFCRETEFFVLGSDLDVLSAFTLPACVKAVPTFSDGNNKINIIVVFDEEGLRASQRSTSDQAFFAEIDGNDGVELWRSVPFSGEFVKDSLGVFGSDIYSGRKAALFSSGVNTFK